MCYSRDRKIFDFYAAASGTPIVADDATEEALRPCAEGERAEEVIAEFDDQLMRLARRDAAKPARRRRASAGPKRRRWLRTLEAPQRAQHVGVIHHAVTLAGDHLGRRHRVLISSNAGIVCVLA